MAAHAASVLAERLFILCGSSIPTYEGSIRVRRCAPEIESVARVRWGSESRSATQGTDDSVFDVVELQSVPGVGELRCAGRSGPGRREGRVFGPQSILEHRFAMFLASQAQFVFEPRQTVGIRNDEDTSQCVD